MTPAPAPRRGLAVVVRLIECYSVEVVCPLCGGMHWHGQPSRAELRHMTPDEIASVTGLDADEIREEVLLRDRPWTDGTRVPHCTTRREIEDDYFVVFPPAIRHTLRRQ